jgi:hypothetical protein
MNEKRIEKETPSCREEERKREGEKEIETRNDRGRD